MVVTGVVAFKCFHYSPIISGHITWRLRCLHSLADAGRCDSAGIRGLCMLRLNETCRVAPRGRIQYSSFQPTITHGLKWAGGVCLMTLALRLPVSTSSSLLFSHHTGKTCKMKIPFFSTGPTITHKNQTEYHQLIFQTCS